MKPGRVTMNRRSFLVACTKAAGAVSIVPEGIFAMNHDARSPGGVCVLDGPGVQHMRAGLERVSCAFTGITSLNEKSLSECRVLVLCGNQPPVGARRAGAIRRFLEEGGTVLAVGGGARCMIENGLFDAEGYYPTGTTIHQSTFDGYHRLTFGYPGAKPEADWSKGVPMLVRATLGPLMELGPGATSILTYGQPYSAAAFQPVGRGLALLIGPDPQGGDVYHEVDRSTLTTGEELKTDRLLANAVAFLMDRTSNLIPNAGFEAHMDLSSEHSNWDVETRDGATKTWCKEGAPEGGAYLKLSCPDADSTATLRPHCPLVVERGFEYGFRCRYRSSAGWEIRFSLFRGRPQGLKEDPLPPISISPSSGWTRVERTVAVPEDVPYVGLALGISGQGEFSLDDLVFQRKAG